MKRRHLSIAILVILTFSVNGQNVYDSNGLRTGPWKGYYPDTTLRYEAVFNAGKPVGLMKRYDEKGRLAATMDFYKNPERCIANIYSNTGVVRARGVYESQLKDSAWNYYSSDGSIRMVENYDNGKLSGLTKNYYPSGSVSQHLYYQSDKKHGPWTRFFENGDTMLNANYTEGMLHGEYISFYPEGKLQISGNYYQDLKDGDWNYYSEEGEILSVIKYDIGNILNPEELEKSYEKFIQVLEENEGELTDPETE